MTDDALRRELIEGEVWESMPTGDEHADIVMRLALLLGAFVAANRLGKLRPKAGYWLSRDPDTLLGPDLSFVRADRLPGPREGGFYLGAPDLAIEVRSPSERPGEVRKNIDTYMRHGTPMLWYLDPASCTATVHRHEEESTTIDESGRLDGLDIIPGFECSLTEILFDPE